MKVLVVGATGYIGTRIIPLLVQAKYKVVALTRSKDRLKIPESLKEDIEVVEGSLLEKESLKKIPSGIDVVYYLAHSMKDSVKNFPELERNSIENLLEILRPMDIKQIIYLTGLVSSPKLSMHLSSRLEVENIIKNSKIPYTVLRAGIIIGSGSASFEIIRDLVEKLPIMIAPKWVKNKCQPLAVPDVLYYLVNVAGNEKCLNRVFDIGGQEQITYKQMLLRFAKFRGLKRLIVTVPVLTPRLSSYWLYFVTVTNFSLAMALVDSLKNDAVCEDDSIHDTLPHKCLSYEEALSRAFEKIEQNAVVSSWMDSFSGNQVNPNISEHIEIPKNGCLSFQACAKFSHDPKQVVKKIWSIGGKNGWYTTNWAWKFRGEIDKLVGGVGLRRGRRSDTDLAPGDALDFWRVLRADQKNMILLLYAEMKAPGQAWLQFHVKPCKDGRGGAVEVTATFRPKGVFGRFYWYSLYPIHFWIFKQLAKSVAR